MPSLLFYFFAAITLIFGAGVVLARNPVASAMSLVVSFVGVAALFISLDAYFIGTLQILVYAGAVMVLFLFIIMLLDIKAEAVKKGHVMPAIGGVFLAVLFSLQIVNVLGVFKEGDKPLPALDMAKAAETQTLPTIVNDLKAGTLPDAKLMGVTLFKDYPLHLQIVGLLLLAGTVGVVVLSKRDRKEESA
ncbi:MAG: NADH-quinone oxidoreductase subunit J [Verrucomicrobiaceae bacterium]|jgi:NADH-quinone oxidoreductase subunit J